MLASAETATLQGRRAIAASVDAKVWVAAECNRYIFYRQVKPDRLQLLPIDIVPGWVVRPELLSGYF